MSIMTCDCCGRTVDTDIDPMFTHGPEGESDVTQEWCEWCDDRYATMMDAVGTEGFEDARRRWEGGRP